MSDESPGDGIAAPVVHDEPLTGQPGDGDTADGTDDAGFYDPALDDSSGEGPQDPQPGDDEQDSDPQPAAKVTASPDEDRRPRGFLDHDVLIVCQEFVDGTFAPTDKEGAPAPLTPHRIATRIYERGSLDKKPSTGAVTNTIRRWGEMGFATITTKPIAFVAFEGESTGAALDTALKDARAARKEAKADETQRAAEQVDSASA